MITNWLTPIPKPYRVMKISFLTPFFLRAIIGKKSFILYMLKDGANNLTTPLRLMMRSFYDKARAMVTGLRPQKYRVCFPNFLRTLDFLKPGNNE